MDYLEGNAVRTSLLWIVVLLAGCSAKNDRLNQPQMAPRMEYQGFSFARPDSPRWFILNSEAHDSDVTLRWDLHSPTHTFYARVALGNLERQPKSHEEFAELARATAKEPDVVRELTRGESLVEVQGQWCIRTDTVDAVQPATGAAQLRVAVHGYRCLHPSLPQRTLEWFYSEQGLPSEFSAILAEDGEKFLRGVRMDAAAPGAAG